MVLLRAGKLFLQNPPWKYFLVSNMYKSHHCFYYLFRGTSASGSGPINIKGDYIAHFAGKLHPDQMKYGPLGAALVGIAFLFDLLQGSTLGKKFHHFEFKEVDMGAELHRHVNAAMVGGIFHTDIKPKGNKITIDNGGVIAFIVGQLILAIPVMGNGGEKRLHGFSQGRKVIVGQCVQHMGLIAGFG